ncbi:MAG: ABC transporter ATP-binding protein [Deltaproteobacteria bacterium]|nr:ABC transporter ATP-binding protein [Deltaproteobacteria bacterium]
MISVKNLEKRYGDLLAVKNVSFEVDQGEVVGLLGQNGAGKTTVMKIITGYLEPTEGSVTVGNIDVVEDRINVQKKIGYMPENAPLYDEMLVQEYLLMMADLRGIEREKQQAAIAEAVRATGVEKVLTRSISTLSKGFRQRVALCQAILHKPEVLILDEPTNGLDPVQIVEIRSLIRKLAKQSTIFLSTHILPEIEAVCDRVIILIDGELATDAKLAELLKSNHIGLSISKGAADVEKQLKSVKGVTSVQDKGPDLTRAGFELWSVDCEQGAAPSPEIVRTAMNAQWEVASIAQERPSLEQVFGALMDEHVRRRREASLQEIAA